MGYQERHDVKLLKISLFAALNSNNRLQMISDDYIRKIKTHTTKLPGVDPTSGKELNILGALTLYDTVVYISTFSCSFIYVF